jgi:pSer/pThr/pTyr-binding forkhead associated (FHA) protein
MPVLRHSAPGQPPRVIPLVKEVLVIGRGQDCDLVFEDNNLSRRHCQIRKWAGFYKIEDLQSKNGTFVNGTKVTVADLGDGDLVAIGDQMLVFKKDEKQA